MEDENNIIYLDGFKVRIKAFNFLETYPNGLPDQDYLHKINKLLTYPDYPLEWGFNHHSVLNRSTIQYDSDGFLPNYIYHVWLQSETSLNDPQKKYDGSQVICVWFGSSIEPNISIQQYVIQHLYKFSWVDNARNINHFIL